MHRLLTRAARTPKRAALLMFKNPLSTIVDKWVRAKQTPEALSRDSAVSIIWEVVGADMMRKG